MVKNHEPSFSCMCGGLQELQDLNEFEYVRLKMVI